MKKLKLLGFVTLFLSASLMLWNCESLDDSIELDQQLNSKIRTISFNSLPTALTKNIDLLNTVSKNSRNNPDDILIIDESQILEVIDTLSNTKFSIKFTLPNQPENVLYNLIVGTDQAGDEISPFVLKYMIDNLDEIQMEGYLDFSKMNATIHDFSLNRFSQYLEQYFSNSNRNNFVGSCREITHGGGDLEDPDDPNNNDGDDQNDCQVDVWSNGETGDIFMINWHCSNGSSGSTSFRNNDCDGGTDIGGGSAGVNNGNCPNGTIVNGVCVTSDDDHIINELTGEEKCMYEKLKDLSLFKSTIKKFEDSDTYDLTLKKGNCSNTDLACTDGSDIANGNVSITFETPVNGLPLEFAAIILHEGIHAELFKYVNEYTQGLDPNQRENLLYHYFEAKKDIDPKYMDALAQHQHMADKYVKPIAEAIRALDKNNYPLEYYMGYGWDGLRRYGYDGYWDNEVYINLDKSTSTQYYQNQEIVNNNTQILSNDCEN